MALQTITDKIKIGLLGPSAMKPLQEIEAERVRNKARLTPEQLLEIRDKMRDFESELSGIVITDLSRADIAVSCLFGILTAISAWQLDSHGKAIEGYINGKTIKDPVTGEKITIKQLDTNNIFDIKRGANHRYQIFHCGNLFKTAPADFVMPDGMSIEELMGMGKSDYRLIELIIKKYGLSGGFMKQASGIVKIMSTHFLKDLVTPAGLPLPFSDIFTKFIIQPSNACGYSTKNLIYDGFLKEVNSQLRFLNIRASDVSSFALIKVFCRAYTKVVHPELDKRQQKSLEDKMIIAVSGFLLISQLCFLCCGKADTASLVNGGKINPMIAASVIKSCVNICREAYHNHVIIMEVYRKKKDLILEVSLNGTKSDGVCEFPQRSVLL